MGDERSPFLQETKVLSGKELAVCFIRKWLLVPIIATAGYPLCGLVWCHCQDTIYF